MSFFHIGTAENKEINDVNGRFWFGQYKGVTVRYILDDDPNYILWLRDNTKIKISQEIIDEAIENSFGNIARKVAYGERYYTDDNDLLDEEDTYFIRPSPEYD